MKRDLLAELAKQADSQMDTCQSKIFELLDKFAQALKCDVEETTRKLSNVISHLRADLHSRLCQTVEQSFRKLQTGEFSPAVSNECSIPIAISDLTDVDLITPRVDGWRRNSAGSPGFRACSAECHN
jgi:hypothetical protein